MTVKTVDNGIALLILFHYHNGLREAVRFQRGKQQAFFRWRKIIWVVIIRQNGALFYPQYAVNRLGFEGAIFMQNLAKGVKRSNLFLFIFQRLQIAFEILD